MESRISTIAAAFRRVKVINVDAAPVKAPCALRPWAALPPTIPKLEAFGRVPARSAGTALSKNQLTPYSRSPVNATSNTCASICTCAGITSSRSMARRIDSHCAGLARTISALLSSMALMPMPDSPLPVLMPAPPPLGGGGCEICEASRETAPSSTGVRPGEIDAPLSPPLLLTLASNTVPSCEARSPAFMYFTS